ncbi:lytic murein transglycosylase [Mumia sp. zg.B53]|nr:lytic murein transglycosylase [Mumia sp. zg.B53]
MSTLPAYEGPGDATASTLASVNSRVAWSKGVVVPAALGVLCATVGLLTWAGAGADARVGAASVSAYDPPSTAAATASTTAPLLATSSLDSGVGRLGSGLDRGWVSAEAGRTGIAARAVTAYARAALRLEEEDPGCRLGWTTLAGIGWVESQHGTIDGNTLLADGTTRRPIHGPALDGTGGVSALAASADDTAAHGNPAWDHAVGPMQFIGSTWRRWGSDGDGDGVADRADLDDAAYAAGRYLCANGDDLTTGSGWTAAVRSYNHSDAYVAAVLAAADSYGA